MFQVGSKTHQQIDLQERGLGIQAAAAAEQKTFNEEMLKVEEGFGNVTGEVVEWSRHDPTAVLTSIGILIETAGDVDKARNIERIYRAILAISKIEVSGGGGGPSDPVDYVKPGWLTSQQAAKAALGNGIIP